VSISNNAPGKAQGVPGSVEANQYSSSKAVLLVAGPNLTIDRTLEVDEVVLGSEVRFTHAEVTPGGKGVNVARAASRLGCDTTLVAFAPGHTGAAVARLIAEEGLRLRTVPAAGEVRSSAIVLETGGRVTVLNEPGPRLGPRDWAAYVESIAAELPGHRVLVCSGSVPAGIPDDAYARLVAMAAKRSMLTLVDASGPLLERALDAEPGIVTPNLSEAEALLWGAPGGEIEPHAPDAGERALRAARAIVKGRGPRVAIVTAGAAGAAAAWRGGERWVEAVPVQEVNPIGAGDVFVAALTCTLAAGRTLGAAVASAVGAAAAGLERPLAGDLDRKRARALGERSHAGDWGPER
jgi:1-phosphofructokinase family hexose kinase